MFQTGVLFETHTLNTLLNNFLRVVCGVMVKYKMTASAWTRLHQEAGLSENVKSALYI